MKAQFKNDPLNLSLLNRDEGPDKKGKSKPKNQNRLGLNIS
jgi:hypothetical protein